MNSDRIIVVLGATGRQGGAVTRALLADGWRVRAVTRKPRSPAAGELAGLGADVVGADMAEPATLAEAFRGAYGVYSVQNHMISGLDAEVLQGKNVGAAASAAGVEHIVYGSAGVGVPTGVGSWDSKLAVQAHLESLTLPLTVLRPMAFMQLMTDRGFYPPLAVWHTMPKLMGADRPVFWLAVEDLGAIAARAFAEPDRFIGADLALASDIKTIDECREIWREVTGRTPRSVPMPTWLFERFTGKDLTTMWRWLHTATPDTDPAETLKILPAAMTVRDWVTRHRSAAA